MANLILKPLVGGERPDPQTLSSARRLKGQPLSGAFPSGHSASAAAFATGASLSWPVLTPILAPLAGLVGYSRIHTGAHWLSDVLAGLALGTGIGIVTNVALTDRDTDAHTEDIAPRADVPRLPRGKGLVVVANPHSGPDGSEDPATVIRRLLPEATLLVPGRDGANEDLDVLLKQAVNMPGARALGVSGGDGTVSAAARLARTHHLPLAVFPGGTLNHFAKALGTDSFDATAQAITSGTARLIDTAELTVQPPERDRTTVDVLNTFSLGAYPQMVAKREELESRTGKWLGGILASLDVARQGATTEIAIDGDAHTLWLTFVGINTYVPPGLVPATRTRLDTSNLDIRDYRADSSWAPVRFVGNSLLGRRGDTLRHRITQRHETSESRPIRSIEILCASGYSPENGSGVDLAYDGETLHVSAPYGSQVQIKLTMLDGELTAYAP